MKTSFRSAFIASLLISCVSAPAQQAGNSPVKIFIMAGQSNMLGHGNMSPVSTQGTLEYIVANDPGNDYQFLVDGGGNWIARDDVWIKDQDPSFGNLTAGYGSSTTTVGPELGFGHKAGDLYENQVLIVKAAWGGKSLAADFRPPSSGGATGSYYNDLISLVNDAIANLGTYFPGYDAAGGYEIAGFCWHQGWNDRVTAAFSAEYETNMANFIRDIRDDLEVPGLPFVIATTGMGGGLSYSEVENAQLAMANTAAYPDFAGNVSVVDTRLTYDGLSFWEPMEFSPADQNYHWNRNAKTYVNIGLAMADAMSMLAPGRCPARLRATAGSPGGVLLNWQNGLEIPASVQIFRDSVEIATVSPVSLSAFSDTTAQPGLLKYELVFTMPGDPCDPLTVTFDGGISGLEAFRSPDGIGLTWTNNMVYDSIEVRRDGTVLDLNVDGTATTFIDTSPPSSGLITYTAVPGNGTAAPASTEINLEGPSAGSAVIYEPFDYEIGGLSLKSGNSEVGLEGSWNANGTSRVVIGSLEYGSLPTGGGSIGDLSASQNRYGGARAIRASALAGNGLLDDGATLWFSLIMGYGTGGNLTNSTLAFALANSPFNGGNYRYFIDNEGAQLGSGVGVTLGRVPNINGRTVATLFQDGSFGTGFAGNVRGTWEGTGTVYGAGEHGLIVGKIVWGADSDTIELYQPDTELHLGPVTSTLTVDVDQSTYDTITFSRGDIVTLDEIRFGANYEDVIGAGSATDYDNWAADYPSADLSDPSADFDRDGVTNDNERIWGTSPADNTSLNPFTAPLASGGTIAYTRRDPSLTNLNYTVWTSADLTHWTEDTGASQTPTPGANDIETVAVTLSVSPVDGRLFVRVQAAK